MTDRRRQLLEIVTLVAYSLALAHAAAQFFDLLDANPLRTPPTEPPKPNRGDQRPVVPGDDQDVLTSRFCKQCGVDHLVRDG